MALDKLWGEGKDLASSAGKMALSAAESGRAYIGLAAIALAGLSMFGSAKMLSPEAVADEADEFLLNETLKTSLAKSRQDNEILRNSNKAKELRAVLRLPHDRFV